MPYQEIALNLIDSNPWQTRKEYDKDILVSMMATATDELGIRNAPLIRPTQNGRYQIASGHGRIEAWKALDKKTIMCRVEELTDAQMKKEILVENVNRKGLNEDERFQALEQYREELGLEKGSPKFIEILSKATGVPEGSLGNIYDVKRLRELISVSTSGKQLRKKPSFSHIRFTQGLLDEERVKLVVKSTKMGWSAYTTFYVKTALKEMQPEVRVLLLDKKSKLPKEVIIAIGTIETPEEQMQAIHYIKTHKLDEELAIQHIEAVKAGKVVEELRVVDEAKEVIEEFERVYHIISGWGVNQYMIIGRKRWEEHAIEIFKRIKEKLQELIDVAYKKEVIDIEQ